MTANNFTFNNGKDWTTQEKKMLRDFAKQHINTAQIASLLGRTEGAVYAKASRLNISLKPRDHNH